MKHIPISDPTVDLRALREVYTKRRDQAIFVLNDTPMASGAWRRELGKKEVDVWDVAIRDIDLLLNSHGARP